MVMGKVKAVQRTGNKRALSGAIASVEKAFGASVVLYATGAREPAKLFGAQVASDVLPIIGEHLEDIGQVENLALIVHTRGGALDTPWPLVSLLRSHAKRLLVLVPEIALSAGTLIALGADQIFMLPHAFLSPVDPTANLKEEGKQQSLSVEDVMGYIHFVTDKVGIRDQEALVEALKELTKEVKATLLGNIHRTHSLIARLARSMLQLHLTGINEQQRIDQIVDMLTHSLYTHQHMIPLMEARDVVGLGSMIEEVQGQRLRSLMSMRKHIREELMLLKPFDAEDYLSPKSTVAPKAGKGGLVGKHSAEFDAVRAIVESSCLRHKFVTKYKIDKMADGQISFKPTISSWQRLT
jgi:hypothetical protein